MGGELLGAGPGLARRAWELGVFLDLCDVQGRTEGYMLPSTHRAARLWCCNHPVLQFDCLAQS